MKGGGLTYEKETINEEGHFKEALRVSHPISGQTFRKVYLESGGTDNVERLSTCPQPSTFRVYRKANRGGGSIQVNLGG